MTKQLPADRPLPHRQEILERILADEAAPPRRSRTWLIPVGAAASIALIATGALIASGRHADTTPAPPAADPTPTRTNNAGPADVHIDAGPVTGAEKNAAVQACLVTVGQGSATPAVVGHAVKVRSWVEGKVDTTIAVIGYACVGRGGPWDATTVAVGRNGKVVGNPPDATHPAAPTDGTGARLLFVDFDRKPDLLVQEGWYNVDDRVATMRQRWIVRGKPGPWYVAQAADGLVYLRSWNESAALKVGEQVRVETQVLDRDGRLLDAPADQKGGGGLTPSPGTTRVDVGTVVRLPGQQLGDIRFTK